MARLGMTADASPDAWRFCATAEEAVADVGFIQENAPERMAIKRELYARLDPVRYGAGVLDVRKIIDGVAEQARGRSISELVRERDAVLLPLLELVAKRSQ